MAMQNAKNSTDGRQTAVGRTSDGHRTHRKFLDGRKNTTKSERHFWANFAAGPGIFEYRNPILKNLGTIGKIRPKVAFRFFRIFPSVQKFSVRPTAVGRTSNGRLTAVRRIFSRFCIAIFSETALEHSATLSLMLAPASSPTLTSVVFHQSVVGRGSSIVRRAA